MVARVVLLLVFSLLLLAAVLLSSLANRTVLSTAALFLLAGFILGKASVGVLRIRADDELVSGLAELALFSILFSDGMRAGVRELRSAWRLPGRALGLGLPLTLAATAALAHYVAGLSWVESFLIGAVLSPTDPVFAAAIVGREEIPYRLRNLLSIESGLNDGLALPIVIVLLAAAGSGGTATATLLAEVLGGIAIGIAVPASAIWLEGRRFLAASAAYQPLNAVAVGLIVLATATLTHANVFLAAFSAGITIASLSPPPRPRHRALALKARSPRTPRRCLVRAEGLRLGGLRAPHPRRRARTKRRAVPPRRARRRRVDPCPLIHRCRDRPLVRAGNGTR